MSCATIMTNYYDQAFAEFRSTSVSNLMYVKEDLVLPHNMSFYDLIISKARGKSGPLFHFDVYDDIRLEHNANVEKEESHAGETPQSKIALCSAPTVPVRALLESHLICR